ncbi:MAG TPA: hypothetical protein VKY74_15925, partial [Chloroflexia bacterium]|nr:hypothetical protein [Chloroflexia bacterium]
VGDWTKDPRLPIQNPKSKIQNPIVLVVLLLACGGYLAMAAAPADWYAADLQLPSAAAQGQLQKIVALVRQAPPGRYFADDPGLLALAGQQTDYDDPFTMTALAAAGRWDATAFEARLRQGAFPLVLLAGDVAQPPRVPLRADILTPTMRAATRAGYTLLYPDIYFTYVPRPR